MKSPASLRKPVLATLVVALGAALLPTQAVAADEAQWVPGRLLVQPRAGLSEAEFDKAMSKLARVTDALKAEMLKKAAEK